MSDVGYSETIPQHTRIGSVFQINKNVVRIHCIFGYEIAVMVGQTSVEAFISSTSGDETIRMKLQVPTKGQRITVTRQSADIVDVIYE